MHWRKMIFRLWLLLFMTPVAVAKCGSNSYYDGLMEECQPCSIRCKSPPAICVKYCKSASPSTNEDRANRNIHVILIAVFVFLGAFITLTLIQVVRRKACRPLTKVKVHQPETSESDRGSEATEKSDAGSADVEDATCNTQCNTSLPLPSTEEGTTVLVTTKTVQTYNCRAQHTEDVTLGVWRTEII